MAGQIEFNRPDGDADVWQRGSNCWHRSHGPRDTRTKLITAIACGRQWLSEIESGHPDNRRYCCTGGLQQAPIPCGSRPSTAVLTRLRASEIVMLTWRRPLVRRAGRLVAPAPDARARALTSGGTFERANSALAAKDQDPSDLGRVLLEIIEDCQPQQKERQQAERPTGDADNLLFICAHFIRSRTDGSRPADDRSDLDLFDALPFCLIP
jgi:hypothetical protein